MEVRSNRIRDLSALGLEHPGDAVFCTGVYTETIVYDSNLAWQQEGFPFGCPVPEGYYWWVGAGPAVETPQDQDLSTRRFRSMPIIRQAVSTSTICWQFVHGVNQERSDHHVIWVVDEYTPRELRASVEGESVFLKWMAPVSNEGSWDTLCVEMDRPSMQTL